MDVRRAPRIAFAILLTLTAVVGLSSAAAADDVFDPPYPGIILNAGPFPPSCSVSLVFPCAREQTAAFTVTGSTFTQNSVIVDLDVTMLPFTFVANQVTYHSYDAVVLRWDESFQYITADGGQHSMLLPEYKGGTVIGQPPHRTVVQRCNPGACRIEFARRPWMVARDFWMPVRFAPVKDVTPPAAGNVDQSNMIALSAPSEQGPTARFSSDDLGARRVRFDGSASTAVGSATIASWNWTFSDGTAATGAQVVKTFPRAGTYRATLTVRDSNGLTDTLARDIVVGPSLVVNSVGDAPNAPDADGDCDTGNQFGDSAECTLRAAIEAANFDDDASVITFGIDVAGTPRIGVEEALPQVVTPTTIDGSTQPGGAVEVRGSSTEFNGIDLRARATVTGLTVQGFDHAILASATGVTIKGNRIGTDPTGTEATSPPTNGILVGNGTDLSIVENVVTASERGIQSIARGGGTIRGNRVGVVASGTSALERRPPRGIELVDARPWTVDGNVVSATFIGIVIRGTSDTGSILTKNAVGVDPARTHLLGESAVGILVDAVPGVTVSENDVAAKRGGSGSIDIGITGASQLEDGALSTAGSERSGPVTGGDVHVTDNKVGTLASETGTGGTHGIAVWAQAPDVTVRGNHVAGHQPISAAAFESIEIAISGGQRATVEGNVVGTNSSGSAALGGQGGVVVEGATDALVTGNVVAGLTRLGILVRDYQPTPSAALVRSERVDVEENKIGVNSDGTRLIGIAGNGVQVEGASTETRVRTNVVSGNQRAGVIVADTAAATAVVGNLIGTKGTGSGALGNGVGVVVRDHADQTAVLDNVIGASTDQGVLSTSDKYTSVFKNQIGRNAAGEHLPNDIGIAMGGPGIVSENTVWFNLTDGISTSPDAAVVIVGNSTSENGGKGISGPTSPAPPKLDVVAADFGTEQRTWFVVETPGVTGVVELFVNPDCTDPDEGRTPVRTNQIVGGLGLQVLTPIGKIPPGTGYTVTVTVFDGPPAAKQGRTSAYSNSAVAKSYPDTSLTGIPDIVQHALAGDPSRPHTAVFPGDGGGRISLRVPSGQLRNVHPVTPPEGAAALNFPAGLFSFEITGLEPGARTSAAVDTDKGAAQYWRYGARPDGESFGWYPWMLDENTGLGALAMGRDASGLATSWFLSFVDGLPGDDDRVANGTIVDPGAPATGDGPPQPTTTTTTVPPTTISTTTTVPPTTTSTTVSDTTSTTVSDTTSTTVSDTTSTTVSQQGSTTTTEPGTSSTTVATSGSTSPTTDAPPPTGTLPFTGGSVLPLVVVGIAMLAGAALATRRRTSTG